MEHVFPAIEARFNRDGALRKAGRKLYEGSTEVNRVPHDYVELTTEDVDRGFDTFDTSEPVYTLLFTVRTKENRPTRCSKIMRHIRRVFNAADLQSNFFETSVMRILGEAGPVMDDATFRGEVRFLLHITLNTEQPSVLMTS